MSQHLNKNNWNGTGLAKAFPVITSASQLPGGSKEQKQEQQNGWKLGESQRRGGKNGNKMREKDLAEGLKNGNGTIRDTLLRQPPPQDPPTLPSRTSINLELIVLLSVGSRGGSERGRGGVAKGERERERGENPPFTRGSVLARFPGTVDLAEVYAEDFFGRRLLLTWAWIQSLLG